MKNATNRFAIPRATCRRCGKTWAPHTAAPLQCPGCRRRYWWVPAGTLPRGNPRLRRKFKRGKDKGSR